MKYVHINSFSNGSTGTIMRHFHNELLMAGEDSYAFWGRKPDLPTPNGMRFSSDIGVLTHSLLTRITDRVGFYSRRDTAKLLQSIESINPDVVHLHNLHGYYLNISMLFDWLRKSDCRIEWTLHDCWAFTGHCAYFTHAKCNRWIDGCYSCPLKQQYPASMVMDSSKENYKKKRELFTSIPQDRMTLYTPSEWLKQLVLKSYLNKYEIKVFRNPIDTSVFRPTDSCFREAHGLQEKFMVLGVASIWSAKREDDRKGFTKFLNLANVLGEDFVIVLVGLTDKQISNLPENVVGLNRTESKEELAQIYTAADVFVSMSLEETFGMTVVEAQCCGTHAIVQKGTACEEVVDKNNSSIVGDSIEEIADAIKALRARAQR